MQTDQEYFKMLKYPPMSSVPDVSPEKRKNESAGLVRRKRSSLPQQFDWKQKGMYTEIEDQDDCNSCWAFAAVAAVEGQWALKHGKSPEKLSKQQLVDCFNPEGCDAGYWPHDVKSWNLS